MAMAIVIGSSFIRWGLSQGANEYGLSGELARGCSRSKWVFELMCH